MSTEAHYFLHLSKEETQVFTQVEIWKCTISGTHTIPKEKERHGCVLGGGGGVFYETDNQKNHGPRKKPTLKLKKYDCLVFHRCLFFQSNLCFPPLCLTI